MAQKMVFRTMSVMEMTPQTLAGKNDIICRTLSPDVSISFVWGRTRLSRPLIMEDSKSLFMQMQWIRGCNLPV